MQENYVDLVPDTRALMNLPATFAERARPFDFPVFRVSVKFPEIALKRGFILDRRKPKMKSMPIDRSVDGNCRENRDFDVLLSLFLIQIVPRRLYDSLQQISSTLVISLGQ